MQNTRELARYFLSAPELKLISDEATKFARTTEQADESKHYDDSK